MRKFYLLALLCTCFSLSLFANGIEIDGIYYLLDSTNYTASVTYSGLNYDIDNNYTGEVTIPSSLDYNNQVYSVTSIGNRAFYKCNSLTSVTIPYSVTSIEGSAFSYCTDLTSIVIPNSVTSIGSAAFSGCSGLTAIEIPSSVTSMELAFLSCSNLTQLDVEAGNTTYDSRDNCNAIIKTASNTLIVGCQNTTIPNSVTSIGNYAFMDCENLISIIIPNSVISIGSNAFHGCTSLTSIEIPSSVERITTGAFGNCNNLQWVSVANNNSTYDSRNNCNAIVESSTNKLVLGCQNTTIPNSVTSIGNDAFMGCENLISIIIPNSVTDIGAQAFYRNKCLTSVTISNNIINIGPNAFYGCSSLNSILIPAKVTNIGKYAFQSCSSLNSVYLKATNPPTLGNGSVFNSIPDTAILYVPYKSIEAYKAIVGYADSFAEIKGFSDVEDITDTTATLKWIPDTAVVQYDINIYTSDTLFAHYVVDGNGQIISSQHYAPSIYYHKLDTTVSSTEYFVISLDGLSAGTDYTYTIEGTNSESAPIYHEEGSFTTLNDNEEGFLDAISNEERKPCKILRNGQIYILRGDKTYTLQGQEVK